MYGEAIPFLVGLMWRIAGGACSGFWTSQSLLQCSSTWKPSLKSRSASGNGGFLDFSLRRSASARPLCSGSWRLDSILLYSFTSLSCLRIRRGVIWHRTGSQGREVVFRHPLISLIVSFSLLSIILHGGCLTRLGRNHQQSNKQN
nr:unnamed protein product [Callosobruchus analis]